MTGFFKVVTWNTTPIVGKIKHLSQLIICYKHNANEWKYTKNAFDYTASVYFDAFINSLHDVKHKIYRNFKKDKIIKATSINSAILDIDFWISGC